MLRRVKVIGLMSGTSADAIDAALVEWPDGARATPFQLLAYLERPLEAPLQQRIHRLCAGRVPGEDTLAELTSLDVLLGEHFAEAARAVARQAAVPLGEIAAIASHGQTVAHHPELRGSLQIGDPSVIAERTGCRVVADFRARDLAAGGEGAPLAPFFHWAAMASAEESRAVLNLGGMANLTWLPRGGSPEDALAFDVGPANALLDGAICTWSEGALRMDRDGARAARGRVHAETLERLLADPFFRRPPPKSTGRERYGLEEAEELVRSWRKAGRGLEDLLATLVALTAESVARACRELLPGALERLLVGGGGTRNRALLRALAARLPGVRIGPFDEVGVPADAAEAMAFSLLGRNALLGLPNHLPRCTGARGARVLGEQVPAGGAPLRA